MKDSNRLIPNHIGIIMDGNGRWANSRLLPRSAGHKQGSKVFEEISRYAMELGVKYLTVYAFSTENWKRPEEEVNSIMDLLSQYLKEILKSHKKGVTIRFIGDRSQIRADLIELIEQVEAKTNKGNTFTVNIALNYGGRSEITHSVKAIGQLIKEGKLSPEDITEDLIEQNLYTLSQPSPDIIIRPGGEKRISNFMLWQGAYSELIFTDVLWPDFTKKDLDNAIDIYSARNRRYGGI